MSQILQKEWTDYKSVQKAFRKIKAKSNTRQVPHSSFMLLKCWLGRYSDFTKLNPDEIIDEGLKDPEKSEERISDFFSKVVNQEITYETKRDQPISFNTALSSIYGHLRGFYTKNNVNTTGWITPKKKLPKVDMIDSNYPMFTRQDNGDLDLNRELLSKYFKKLSVRDEMIAMCLMTSGVDISDILRLNIEDVKYQTQDRIFIVFTREKTGESGKTFFSKETTQKLRKFIEEYKADARDTDSIFTTSNNKPLFNDDVAHAFRRAQISIGIEVKRNSLSPIRSKRLRKVFKSAGTRAGLEDDLIRVFMGQASYESKKYLGKSREELEFYYEKIEPFVTMSRSATKPFEEKLKRVEKENLRLRGLLDNQNTNESLLTKLIQNPNLMNELNDAIEKELAKD